MVRGAAILGGRIDLVEHQRRGGAHRFYQVRKWVWITFDAFFSYFVYFEILICILKYLICIFCPLRSEFMDS